MAPDRVPLTFTTPSGVLRLLPDLDRPRAWLLTVDGSPQSHVDLDDPTHVEFEYVQRLAHAVDLAAPPGTPLTALHLGAGGLTLPRYLAATRPGSRQVAAEIDPDLAEAVRTHLPWEDADLTLRVADARAVAEDTPAGSVDVLVVDVFGGDRIPAHLTSLEFVRGASRALRPDGPALFCANLAGGGPDERLAFVRGQLATATGVFAHVCLIAEPAVLRGRRYGNVVLLASDNPLPLAELSRRTARDAFPARVVHGESLSALIGDARPVTDAEARPSPPPPAGAFTLS